MAGVIAVGTSKKYTGPRIPSDFREKFGTHVCTLGGGLERPVCSSGECGMAGKQAEDEFPEVGIDPRTGGNTENTAGGPLSLYWELDCAIAQRITLFLTFLGCGWIDHDAYYL